MIFRLVEILRAKIKRIAAGTTGSGGKRSLADLDDRLLQDLGISREQAHETESGGAENLTYGRRTQPMA